MKITIKFCWGKDIAQSFINEDILSGEFIKAIGRKPDSVKITLKR